MSAEVATALKSTRGLKGIFSTSVGKKAVVAVTGLGLTAFLVVHLLGNLQFFLGPEPFNNYAHTIKSLPVILWGARIGLLLFFVTHISLAIQLKRQNFAARPVRYAFENTVQATASSRSMLISGSIILIYAIYHIAHFTLGVTHPQHFQLTDTHGNHDVYQMVKLGFLDTKVAIFYIASMAALAFHLSHGFASVFQTLGLSNPKQNCGLRKLACALAGFLFVGFSSIPFYVMFFLK